MTKREPTSLISDHGRKTDRRTPLRSHVDRLQAGEPLALEQLEAADAKKVERNAIAAVMIAQVMEQSQRHRSARPPYGLIHAHAHDRLTIPLSNKDRAEWSPADYNRALHHELLETLAYDLDEHITAMYNSQDRIYQRFVQLLPPERGPRGFIQQGLVTALDTMELMVNMVPTAQQREKPAAPPLSPSEQAGILKNSFPLLAKLASEHLEVAIPILNELGRHPEYFELQEHPNGSRLDLSKIGMEACRTIKQRTKTEGRIDSTITGCPAMVKMGESNAIEGLLHWYADSYSRMLETANRSQSTIANS